MANFIVRQHQPQSEYTVGKRGVESVLLYNGLVMNDRRRADAYIIKEINGIDDADVRDSREDNPDRDGETPYSAFHSGRTVTLKGYIRAGNVAKLRAMENDLIYAFSSLEEKFLHFLYLDQYVNFSNANDLADWTWNSGQSETSITGGSLTLTASTAVKQALYTNRAYYNSSAVIEIDQTSSSNKVGIQLKSNAAGTSSIMCQVDLATKAIAIFKQATPGTYTSLQSVNLSTFNITVLPSKVWLKASIYKNIVKVELWIIEEGDDFTYDATAGRLFAYNIYTLTGGDATAWGDGVTGYTGFRVFNTALDNNLSLNTLDVRSIDPGDLRLKCRKFSKIDMTDSFSSANLRKDFLITLRSANGLLESREAVFTTVTTTTGDATFDASGNLTFPSNGSGIPFGSLLSTIANTGPRPCPVKFQVKSGPVEYGISNVTDRKAISVGLTTASDVDINTGSRLIESSSNGTNLYSKLGSVYQWFSLFNGNNQIYFGSPTSAVTVYIWYRPTF